MADGLQSRTIELPFENKWEYTFTDLPLLHETTGGAVVYTVEEEVVVGYESKITGTPKDGFTVTNEEVAPFKPGMGTLDVKKVWVGNAQESATINLFADGKKVESVVLSKTNNWKHTFKNSPNVNKASDKKAIEYTIKEVEIKGYNTEITVTRKDGFTVTNT